MASPRRRALWITLTAIVLLAVVAILVLNIKIHAFLRSEGFRRLVEARAGEALQSDTAFAPLRWTGDSLFSDSFGATGLPSSIVEQVRADQIRAQVNWRAAFSGAWRVDRVDVVNFDGTFRPGSQNADEAPPPPAPGPGLPSFLPQRFEIGLLHVAKARVAFRGIDGRPVVTVADSAIEVRPEGTGWEIAGDGGSLALPSLPGMTITSFRSRLQNGTYFLTDAQLRLGETGKISASGEFADASKVRVTWERIDVATFLDEAWRARLSGFVAGNALAEWPAAGPSAGSVTGSFKVTDGLVQSVATLEQVAAFTGAPQFRRMPLQEFSSDFIWAKNTLTLTNLVAESKGLMRVEGVCTVGADGAIDGKLRVGVTPQTLQWLPGSRERVFRTSLNGYVWTDVRLSGTLQHMKEDLSARLVNAMKDEVIDTGVRTIENLPGAARDGAGKVIDLLSPLIK